jgi:4-amino-4-deoxy-L-arabinose transferase-like glycosyltransferase
MPPTRTSALTRTQAATLAGISLAGFLYLMYTSMLPYYGYFIDEFYYIACSKRLAFGYVDHPPLSIALLALSRWLFGETLPAIRLFPALAVAANVFMTGLLARRLGGNTVAVVIAALAAIAMPVSMIMGSFYSMNAFEPLLWTTILVLVLRMVQEERLQAWLMIGVVLGLGLEMKHTMVVYAIALVAGMLMTPARRFILSRWFFIGMGIAALLLLPNIIWQLLHGFPSLEFYRNAMVNKNVPTGPVGILTGQALFAPGVVCKPAGVAVVDCRALLAPVQQ